MSERAGCRDRLTPQLQRLLRMAAMPQAQGQIGLAGNSWIMPVKEHKRPVALGLVKRDDSVENVDGGGAIPREQSTESTKPVADHAQAGVLLAFGKSEKLLCEFPRLRYLAGG